MLSQLVNAKALPAFGAPFACPCGDAAAAETLEHLLSLGCSECLRDDDRQSMWMLTDHCVQMLEVCRA
eukprot:15138425-Alexandrium_andersonii.AAC.1